MQNKINAINVRIHTLEQRDPVMNANIIRKLRRRLRMMVGK